MSSFRFKQFTVQQNRSAMKVGTDAMLLGALIDVKNVNNALEIGAGTGVISLMVAQKSHALIEAVEIDPESAAECIDNFKSSPWSVRLKVTEVDFNEFHADNKFDLIFSNPPYYSSTLKNQDSRLANAKHIDGLTPERIMCGVSKLLKDNAVAWFILPYQDKGTWIQEGKESGLFLVKSVDIYGKAGQEIKRSVLIFTKTEKNEVDQSTLTVRAANGDYTDEYRELTFEFHANQI